MSNPKEWIENHRKWDEWYYNMCVEVSKNSKCLSRKIGAILVRDKSIISQGYNGPPRGIMQCDKRWFHDSEIRKCAGFENRDHKSAGFESFHDVMLKDKCPRYAEEFGFKSGEGLEWCVAGHAERNTLINAARHGIATKGAKLYMDCGIPCTPCLVEIINAGIEEIIVSKMTFYDKSAEYVLTNSKLKYRVYDHLKDVTIDRTESY